MLTTYKQLIADQFVAALCTLNTCVDRCPEEAWEQPVANYKFCQVVFHTLFYADLYLDRNEESQRAQQFHYDNRRVFRDYEELENYDPTHSYEKTDIHAYLQHCVGKARQVLAAETAESLQQTVEFPWLNLSRAEMHVYNIRHIQHHAAQLSLRLRLDYGVDVPWVRSGWRKP